MRFMNIPFPFFRERIYLHITSDVTNYQIYTEAGSPQRAVEVILLIDSGVVVASTSTNTAALRTGGGWAAGSNLILINNGSILGLGGTGGYGSRVESNSPAVCCNAEDGSAGGPALDVSISLFVDNTNGSIYGGGGGGGGGGGEAESEIFGLAYCGGGGGGGQGGTASSGGGAGGRASGSCGSYTPCCTTYLNGDNGSASGPGSGGSGTITISECPGDCPNNLYPAYSGGAGGSWGTAGSSGSTTSSISGCDAAPGSGGAAGKAINLNGNTVIWRGGNNSSQIKGAVS